MQEPLTDLLFSLRKPTLLTTESARGLCRRWRQVEPGDDTDDTSQHALESKKPSLSD